MLNGHKMAGMETVVHFWGTDPRVPNTLLRVWIYPGMGWKVLAHKVVAPFTTEPVSLPAEMRGELLERARALMATT